MGLIVINGIPYGDMGIIDTELSNVSINSVTNKTVTENLDTKYDKAYDVELSMDEYEALPDSKYTDGKNYYIYDATPDWGPTIIYGWSVDPDESDPYNAVAYLSGAIGKTPAKMGSTVFDYGDWSGAFFMPKPCMLYSNGEVAYYLDPNDYTKKIDGTPSDVGNLNFDGNAMMEWPLIWYKFESGVSEGEGYFYVSNKQVDNTYHCWCNVNSENNIVEHFYTAIYNGIIRGNKLRSLSGYRLTPTLAGVDAYSNTNTYIVGDLVQVDSVAYSCITNVTSAEEFDPTKWESITLNGVGYTYTSVEISRAKANNTTSAVEWYTAVLSDRMLISALLILMSKSLDNQMTFGRGLDTGSKRAKQNYVTGNLNDKGLFWGDTTSGTSAIKVFGMENWYGCLSIRTAGLMGTTIDNTAKFAYKLTYNTADGSGATEYNSTATDYLIANDEPTTNNYVKKMSLGSYGMLPLVTDSTATSSTYWTVYFNTGAGYAVFGGYSDASVALASLYIRMNYGYANRAWLVGTTLSCKPLK